MYVCKAMLEAVPSGRPQVRFSLWADFLSDGFYGFRTETHTAKTNVEEAYRNAPHSWAYASIGKRNVANRSVHRPANEMLPIEVGSAVSTSLKTVTVSLLSLLAPEEKGHQKNTE